MKVVGPADYGEGFHVKGRANKSQDRVSEAGRGGGDRHTL